MVTINWLDWPAPDNVKACFTERSGGCSVPPFASFNLALHVNDDPESVLKNRESLSRHIDQQSIHWLTQIHSTVVVDIAQSYPDEADASYCRAPEQVCCVMTADCLPVFFCDQHGQQVAVAHAGWRGLCHGVLQNTVATFPEPQHLLAYLGPAISQPAFEVGEEVVRAFTGRYPTLMLEQHFIKTADKGKWKGDLYGIAKAILHDLEVNAIYGGNRCTFSEEEAFFSYRRNAVTGRMANLIWLE